MSSQIFIKPIPQTILFDLLDKICIKNNKYYILDKISYKKGEYLQLLNSFYEELLPYYYLSKQFYLTRKQTYSTFITIVRQLCKKNNIHYSSKIIYNKSSYDIVYNIYYEI
jgi:hypothetical protein